MDGDNSELLSVRETARRLGVHENTVRNWVRRGTLATARIPGSRFHRFRAVDVERLRKQRGKAAPSLQNERRSINPELATANVLHRWPADASRDSQEHLPELLRRLLVETPGITNISMRSGDGIALGGWDGVADSTGSAFLPVGSLAFEMGVQADVKSKADEDYANRVQPDMQDHVFVFVTPRRWRDKDVWVADRRAEGKFRDVKVIDADDLEGWLKAAPAAHHWISEHLGLQPRDARTIGEWWSRYCRQTKPNLPVELFLAGRCDPAQQLRTRVQDRPSLTTIQSESVEDCLAFIYAALETVESDDAKTVVTVTAPEVWDRIVERPGQSVLVPLFHDADVAAALDGGHHVISVIDRTSVARRVVDITLPRIDRRAAAQAFEKLDMDVRDADRLAVLGRRSLPALKRSIALDPRFKRPSWAHDERAIVLACLVLAGSWTTSDQDMGVLETLTGRSSQDLNRIAQSIAATDDPVLRKVGTTWMVVSPEEAFLYLAESLTPEAMERWREVVCQVLLQPDPMLDLTGAERIAAQMEGRTRQVSSTLLRGVATGLALLGTMGSGRSVDGIETLADIARRCVRDLLEDAERDTSGRIWRQLAGVLPLLAEAAPDEFLAAVDSDLRQERPLLVGLFREDEDDALSLGSSSLHPHLLWALETICWSDDYLVDGIRALARLTEVEPGGKSGNRPSSSMATILCGWVRNTAASLETRLDALDAAAQVSPEVGWGLVCDLWPSNQGWVMPPAASTFRDDWAPTSRTVTMAEWAGFAHELVVRAMRLAPGHRDRLRSLVDKLGPLAPQDRALVINLLTDQLDHGNLTEEDRLEIWDALRSVVRRHQRFSTADWAMPEDALATLEELASRYEPSDRPERHAYLFGWHPDLPGVDQTDHAAYQQRLMDLRREAIEVVMLNGGLDRLAALAQRCKAPGQLGWALADTGAVDFADMVPWLSSEHDALREAAANYTRRRLVIRGTPALREALVANGLTGSGRDLFLRCIPATGESWRVLADSCVPTDVETYWKTAPVDVLAPADVPEAISQLISHGRAWTAVGVVSFALNSDARRTEGEPALELDTAVVVDLLNHVLKQAPSGNELSQMSGYYLGEVLDFLVNQGAADTDVARFEFAFYRLLEHHRQPVVLNRALASEPELFVDLVKRVYRGKSEPRREKSEADSNLASQAWWVLQGWTGYPGQMADGGLDANLLTEWIRRARLTLSEADRADIGDEVIGHAFAHSPTGADGVWPAEPVRDLIEAIGSRELENGFIIGRLNSRGITTRGVYDGGQQERDLAAQYRRWSTDTRADWPRTSRILRSIAESYERDARREDLEAELDADRM